jgi:hypothetical protein
LFSPSSERYYFLQPLPTLMASQLLSGTCLAPLAGLSSEQLANALNRVISGSTVTQVRDSIYLVDLVARAKADERLGIEVLTNLQVTTPTGATVPLPLIRSSTSGRGAWIPGRR